MTDQVFRVRQNFRATLAAAVIMSVSIFVAPSAFAHALEQSFMFFSFDGNAMNGRVEVSLADVNEALNLDLPVDHSATSADVERHADAIVAYLKQHISIAPQGEEAALPITGYRLYTIELAQFFVIDFAFPYLAVEPSKIDITFSVLFDVDTDHRNMVVIENDWGTGTFENEAGVSLIFSPNSATQRLDRSDSTALRGFVNMVKLGTHHIWIGIDHILFLLALLLPAVMRREHRQWLPVPRFSDAMIHVVKIITVFTVAHTITLSLAAFGKISLPGRFVESVIAISIAIAALDIVIPIFRHRIWWVVFAFGLFHGFGFASVLGDIGIPQNYLVHSLLGFNVGVELGQLAIVVALFPVLYLLRKTAFYPPVILRVGAAGLIAVSLYWFVERAFLIDLPAGAILNKITGMV